VALVQRNRIDWAHCGDSRLYAFHNGEYARRTDDHSMVDILVKHGEITEEEALLHPDRSKLFTSLGGPDAPQIAFGSIEKVEAGDTILLASDGLWTYFRNRELAALTEYRDLTTACDRLVELTRRRAGGNGDNLSVAMIRSIGGGGRKGLFGGLFNAKSVAPSPLEDSRRFLLAYLRSASGTAAEAASRRIELCADETALRLAITECTPLFASMSSRKKAASFAARALDLLD
jgi:serine/threonine protein phosphatase PrpC